MTTDTRPRPRKLTRRIAAAGLDPAQKRRLLDELRQVAGADHAIGEAEFALIERLLPDPDLLGVPPAPLDALWAHRELVITACIFVAVADGEYGVEEARTVSELAHGLGLSAHQLAALEAAVFAELQARVAAG